MDILDGKLQASTEINRSKLDDSNETIQINANMSLEDIYLTAYTKVQTILEHFYSNGLPENDIIDIKGIAESFHIEVTEKKLGLKNDIFSYKIMGFLDCFDYQRGNYQWTIYVNESIGDLSKRYVIAHEIAHYLLKENKADINEPYTKYCIHSILPKDLDEQLCDIIASFLLMPLNSVVRLINAYAELHRDMVLDIFDWFRYLGSRLGISDYHTILFYQNIKYLVAVIGNYQKEKSEISECYYHGFKLPNLSNVIIGESKTLL